MSKPIENCPQPETPIRERAWTAEQVDAMADAYFQDTEDVDQCGAMLRAFAATLRTPAEQGGRVDGFEDWWERTEADVSSPHDAAKSAWQAALAQNAQGEAKPFAYAMTCAGRPTEFYEKPPAFVPPISKLLPLYLHAERPLSEIMDAVRRHGGKMTNTEILSALAAAPSQPEDAA